MEKKFIQSILFSTSLIVVYAIASPPLPLSAEGTTSFNESARVRKGVVINMDSTKQEYLVNFDGVSVPVLVTASTTITAPNGTDTTFSSLRDGTAIYVFGNYDKESRDIEALKIVMRNRSPMERKTLSRAEMSLVEKKGREKMPDISSILKGLTLQENK